MVNKDPWYNTQKKTKGELTYMSIALLGACNHDCTFCYVDGSRGGRISLSDLKDLFREAKGLGMRKIQLSGGEPLIYPLLDEVVSDLKGLDVETLLITNATLMTAETAEMLADNRVNVGVSFETIDEKISDELSGVSGSHKEKLEGMRLLKEVGYTSSEKLPLNIIMKTLKQNFPSYIETWKWAKSQGIQPILDRAIPNERCKLEWVVEPLELRYLLDEIGKIEGVYHRIPFLNNEGCNRMDCGLHVEVEGSVYPCAGIPVKMGNVKETSLTEIWLNSELANACKDYKSRIKGSCKSCEESDDCSGCRAVAYAITGDIFEADPLCWNYKK